MTDSCGWSPLRRGAILAWVERHRDELPQTLAELAEFPMAFRRPIVSALPHVCRTAIWREHLETFLGPSSNLSPTQRSVVTTVIEHLPAIQGGEQHAIEASMHVLESPMREHFDRDRLIEIFGTLGPAEPIAGLPLPPDADPAAAG